MMKNKSKWLYLSIIFTLVLVVSGLFVQIHNHSPLLADSPTSDFDLGYEQGFKDGYNQANINHVEYRDIIRYVDREVIKEVIVERPIELREFTSVEELKTWLAEDDTDQYVHLVAGKDGICQPSDKYDCDDYALQSQREAAKSGFLISATIVNESGRPHMINLACIGNNIYYIEPQTDQVWFHCYKD